MAAAAAAASDEAYMKRFEEWMKEYNKEYPTPEEKEMRFSAFKHHLRFVEAQRALGSQCGDCLDSNSDMTEYERITQICCMDLDVRVSYNFSDSSSESRCKCDSSSECESDSECDSDCKSEARACLRLRASNTKEIRRGFLLIVLIRNKTRKMLSS
ncbi:hypothetical protein QVD17_03539 [Tagetes erecta]|uniref:Cathepsin propeptide inhibitor domain-containing protein n=1 Tax=Tagetes erecta TaxID=13708 RepID=A0AAD8LES3_TARER|nr:hypothetical protein QVD17_03539 [Tagetes erecta]